jgi:hypothetical protein
MKGTHATALLGAATTAMLLIGYFWSSETVPASNSSVPAVKRFVVFDGTLYRNKPDLSQLGVKPIRIVYEGEFWDPGQDRDRLPSEEKVRKIASSVRGIEGSVVIDIERWPTSPTVHNVSVATAQESVEKYATVLRWFHESAPGLPIGLYGVMPLIDYWRAIEDPSSVAYRSWVADGERARSLVESVEAFYPSLYTFYPDQQGWVKYAVAQMSEARRLANGRPVYVFLWPQYHNSNTLLGMTYLDADYWRLELDTARKYADGVVIWGGWGSDDRPADWDEQAEWWKVTKEFIRALDTTPPSAPQSLTLS